MLVCVICNKFVYCPLNTKAKRHTPEPGAALCLFGGGV